MPGAAPEHNVDVLPPPLPENKEQDDDSYNFGAKRTERRSIGQQECAGNMKYEILLTCVLSLIPNKSLVLLENKSQQDPGSHYFENRNTISRSKARSTRLESFIQ